MGKKESQRNSKIYKTQVLEDQNKYSQTQASDQMVLQASTTQYSFEHSPLLPEAKLSYTPNSSADNLEYFLPLPAIDSEYQTEVSSDLQSIISAELLSALKAQAAGKIALSTITSEYQFLY